MVDPSHAPGPGPGVAAQEQDDYLQGLHDLAEPTPTALDLETTPERVGANIFGLKVVELAVLCSGVLGALVLLVVGLLCFRSHRRRSKGRDHRGGEYDSLGPSIVVYPSYHGKAPQFLSSDISFKLPPVAVQVRRTSSLENVDLLHSENSDVESTRSPGDVDSTRVPGEAGPGSESGAVPPSSLAPRPLQSRRSKSFSGCSLGTLDPEMYRGDALDQDEEASYPEDHLGRLWFKAQYEPTAEKLQVTLVKAKNLQSRTVATANNCDPVVRLHLIPDERRHLQSRQKKKTCNPVFDENFVFQVPSKDMDNHVLRMTVVDTGRTKRRAVIGHVSLPLARLITEDPNQCTMFKMDLEKDTPDAVSDLGELLVSLLYNENLQRLSVTVIEARRVKFRDDRREVQVRLLLQQYHGQVKAKRTSLVRCSETQDSPNFSECFNFHMSAASSDVASLCLQLEQPSAKYGRGHKVIGKCVLGSYMFARGKALAHWNTAFGNPMQQVQQWHSLSN